jgi:hypothetical protein
MTVRLRVAVVERESGGGGNMPACSLSARIPSWCDCGPHPEQAERRPGVPQLRPSSFSNTACPVLTKGDVYPARSSDLSMTRSG